MTKHINIQKQKSSKIYACVKQGANRTDQNFIKSLQAQGFDEYEIQAESGVHYAVVQKFMASFDSNFEPKDAPVTPETQALHDKIKKLEAATKETSEPKVETNKPKKGKK